MADQIADHINSQAASPSSDPNDCQLVPAGGQFKAAPGVTPLFQPHMAEKLTTAIQSLNDQGIVPVMTGGYVSQEAQDKLHTQSANLMAKPAKISAHGIGLGVDFRPNSNSPNVEAIRDAMATAGLQNGANFKNNPDPNHYFSPDAPQKQTPAMVQACADAYAKLILGDQE
ncbi:MAG: hypothetical protein EPO08_17375 [Rhodospirillaceae bacterium]|nr:MAG: hypothetical protein EPO08_17375 [Rhodospirillaceae bacterium]